MNLNKIADVGIDKLRITKEDAIKEYEKKFGGFPYFLYLSASDEVIIDAIKKALNEGKEISPKNKNIDY